MRGIIFTNAYSTLAEASYQPIRLKEEFEKLGVDIDIKRNSFFPCQVGANGSLRLDLQSYDFCVYWDKDKYVLKALALQDFPVFNSHDAITTCDDKMLTYLALCNKGIKMAKTLPGLLCYDNNAVVDEDTSAYIGKTLGYPLIVKESYGSLGKGVYLAHNSSELLTILEKVKNVPHLFQEYIATSYGKDLRVIVVGDKVLGGMIRQSNNDFRSNLAAGGHGISYPLDEKIEKLALKIASILGLDYCGIDLLFGADKEFIVCEVNSNAFFYGFENATKINVAKAYVEHILKKLNMQKNSN